MRYADSVGPTENLEQTADVEQVVPVAKKPREFGFDDGLGWIAENFDAPLPPHLFTTPFE